MCIGCFKVEKWLTGENDNVVIIKWSDSHILAIKLMPGRILV
jgi:hypothetical protein